MGGLLYSELACSAFLTGTKTTSPSPSIERSCMRAATAALAFVVIIAACGGDERKVTSFRIKEVCEDHVGFSPR